MPRCQFDARVPELADNLVMLYREHAEPADIGDGGGKPMAVFRYLVTVETEPTSEATERTIQSEIGSNLESVISDYRLADFTVETLPPSACPRGHVRSYRERVIRSYEQ